MEENQLYSLAEGVDEYMIMRGVNKKKYYSQYLVQAKYVWKHLFKNTIYAVQSEWKTLKKGVPYNYIDKPLGAVRVFSISDVDECGRIHDLFYDNKINVLVKPTTAQKKCGCTACDCGGLCDDVNSMTYTTKLLFSVLGVDYYEKIWIKVCPNGDVIEYRIVPTKKYNDFVGDSGDYMEDYMNDFDIGSPPFSNYTIVYPEFQKTLCKLETRVCGCPENTQENIDLLITYCSHCLPVTACCRKKKCNTSFLGEINNKRCRGSIKVSECGNKFYYIPKDAEDKVPEFLLINYQTSGENCNETVQVPDYAIETLFYGIDHYSKRFNNSFSWKEKDDAKYAWNNAQNELILFLNPLSLELLSNIQDAEIKF